jgi:hypothetical protein
MGMGSCTVPPYSCGSCAQQHRGGGAGAGFAVSGGDSAEKSRGLFLVRACVYDDVSEVVKLDPAPALLPCSPASLLACLPACLLACLPASLPT